MKFKKVVSGVLAFAMVMTSVVSTTPLSVSAEEQSGSSQAISVSEIHYTAPAEGEQPQPVTVVIGEDEAQHEQLSDRAENPASLVAAVENGEVAYSQEDGVWGFNAQYKAENPASDDKFNVYGDAQMLVSFRLFLKELPTGDNVVSIFSRGEQYGIQLTSSGLRLTMKNEQNETVTTSLSIDQVNKWYDVVAVIEARNGTGSRLYVDGQVSPIHEHRNILSTDGTFALGCKVEGEEATVSESFAEKGYLADVKFYNSRKLSDADRETFRLNLNLKRLDILPDAGLSEIQSLIDAVEPTANFSLKPYDMKTVWQTGDEEPVEGAFQCATDYKAITTLTARDGYDFSGNTSDTIKLVDNYLIKKITGLTGEADCEEGPDGGEKPNGPGNLALDGDTTTYWHSAYNGNNTSNVSTGIRNGYTITLPEKKEICEFRYLPRNNGGSTSNGCILECKLLYKENSSDTNWTTLKDNIVWANNVNWKTVDFEPVKASLVRIEVTKSTAQNRHINAAEFEVYEAVSKESTKTVTLSDNSKVLTVTAAYNADQNPCTSNIDRVAFESRVTLEAEATHQITNSVYAADGHLVSEHPGLLADSEKIKYTYAAKAEDGGATDVIEVSDAGMITAKKTGTAIVTATATLDDEELSSRDIPVTVVGENTLLKNPLVTLKSPAADKYPEIATATLQRTDLVHEMVSGVADVVEGGSVLEPIDADETPVIETVDGIVGFAARYKASEVDQQFNVLGENPMVITLKLYLKQLPSDAHEHTILSKGNQYNLVVMKNGNGHRLRLQISGGNWSAWAYDIDESFLNQWHDIVVVADGKGNMNSVGFFVDGTYGTKIGFQTEVPEITETESGVNHLRQFAVCDKTDEENMQFTSDDGYLAGLRFYNINMVDPSGALADKINVDRIGTDNAAAVIQSILDTETPTAHITATPYTMKTTWYALSGNGQESQLDGVTSFTAPRILERGYVARIEFNTYGGFAFGIDDLNNVKEWLTLSPEMDDELYECTAALSDDGKRLEIRVQFLPRQIPVQHFTYASPAADRTARRQPRYDQDAVEKYMTVADTKWLKNGETELAADYEFEAITDSNWYRAESVLTAKGSYRFSESTEYKNQVMEELQTQLFGNVEAEKSVIVSEDYRTMTIRLDYKTPIHMVRFDLDGGSGEEDDFAVQSVSTGRTAVKPAKQPTKAGFAFSYWYTTDEDTEYDFDTEVSADLTLHAKWGKVCTVTFHPELGGFDNIVQTIGEGGKATAAVVRPSANVDFVGWFEKTEDGSWKANAFDFSTTITEDLDLYAKWSATVYFYFSEDLDEEINKEVTVEPGTKVKESDLPVPTKAGYTFKNWYTLDGDDEVVFDKDTVVNEHTYVFAKWEAESYTVEYELSDGSWPDGFTVPTTINYGERLILAKDPAKSGTNFGGWYTDQNCTTRYNFAPATANIKIYAKWTNDTVFTVTYNANADDATITPASVQIVTNESVMVEPQAEREHYEVEGWYTDEACTESNKFAFGEEGTKVTAAITLYAKWQKKTYNVQFNGNGGTLKDGNDATNVIKVEAATSISEDKVPEFVREGFELEGWYKDARLTQKFIFGTDTIDKDNTRLYARWIVPVESITVTPTTVTMAVGDDPVQLTATVLPAEADQTVTWSSDNEDVATVSENGLVSAEGEGTATITAKAGSKTAAVTVTVSEDPEATRPRKINTTSDFGIKSWNTDQGTSYTDRKILVVRNQNHADASFGVVGEGMLVSGQEASDSSISLLQFELPRMSNKDKADLKAATLQLYLAGSRNALTNDQLVAAVVPAESGLTDLNGVDTWTKVSAAVTDWLSVSTNRFELAGESNTYSQSGGSDMGKAAPVASDGNVSIDITDAVKKYSGGRMILAINDKTGVEHYLVRTEGAIGEDKFSNATEDMAPTIRYSYEGEEVTGITINPTEYTLSGAEGGETTVQLTATVTPDTALDKSVTWTTSDPIIATVDENGLVTAVSTGVATITATANGAAADDEVKATATITVTNLDRQEFDITFHANTDGHDDEVTGMPENTTCYDQDQLARPTASPSWAGHTFKGWSTTASGTTAVTWPQTITDDTDFYAIWQESGSTPPPSSGDDDDELENAKKALEEAILAAKDIYEGMNIYTEGTWDAFKAAYEAATGDIDNLDADALKELADSLNQAVEDLVVDEEGLTTAITTELADAQGVIGAGNTQYTSASWDDYVAAYNALKEAAESGASIEELVRLYYELIDARLKLTIDTTWVNAKAALNAALSQASAIYAAGGSKYDAASWTAFENAYKAAYAQKDATIANITLDKLNSLASALNTARLGLKLADGSTGGNTTVVSALKKGDYVEQGGVRYVVTNETTKTVSAQGIASQKKKLKKVTIAATVSINNVNCTVTEIKANAFSKFTKLKKVVIGKNVTKIGNKAFNGCKAMTSLTLNGDVKTFGKQSFNNCKKLKKIVFKGKKVPAFKGKVFKGTPSGLKVTLSKTLKKAKTKKTMTSKLRKAGISKKAKIK